MGSITLLSSNGMEHFDNSTNQELFRAKTCQIKQNYSSNILAHVKEIVHLLDKFSLVQIELNIAKQGVRDFIFMPIQSAQQRFSRMLFSFLFFSNEV